MHVSNLVKNGKSTKEIAETLGLPERTIESHRRRIRLKLSLNNKSADLRSHLLTSEP